MPRLRSIQKVKKHHVAAGPACHGLSRNGNVRVLFQIIPLYKENNECRNDKEYGKRGAHGKIPGTGDLCVCLRGQNMVITADQHGVAKVRQ